MRIAGYIVPAVVVALAAVYLLAVPSREPAGLVVAKEGERPSDRFDIAAFGKLPVLYEGRVQPFDSLARNTLRIISDRSELREQMRDPETGKLTTVRQPATKWLLDVMCRPSVAAKHQVFRFENDTLLTLLGLKARKHFRYAFEEFGSPATLAKLQDQARRATDKPSRERDAFDNQALEAFSKVQLFDIIGGSHHLNADISDPQEYFRLVQWYRGDPQRPGSGFGDQRLPHSIPPSTADGEWRPLIEAVILGQYKGEFDPMLRSFAGIMAAYAAGDATAFNAAVADHASALAANHRAELEHVRKEVSYNAYAPFYHATELYGVAFVLACLSWLGFARPLRLSAVALLVFVLIVHTVALIVRMDLMDRPFVFVTNLYSSAVMIGWGAVLVALVLEAIFRNGLGAAVGACIGLLTGIVAYGLAGDGDTLKMLQAVLDTNFWLATHVTSVTLGYMATFVAGFIAIAYIVAGVFTRALADKAMEKNISRMIYGILCFAVFLSFTGTVLGGIWADQSWGRFWGWDPKENGALMIVLWTALILHARWGGMIGHRGIAVLAVLGNIVVAWSWFGTNQLGIGLHAYGFMDGATYALLSFMLTQGAIAALGMMPLDRWASFRKPQAAAAPSPGPPPLPDAG